LNALRTALVVAVDEAEPVVGDFRRRFDPAVHRRIPGHVTMVFPFASPDVVDADAVWHLYRGAPSFDFELARVERFPEHVWLAPEPKDRFVDLTCRRIRRFPDRPPYGGVYDDDAIPHLTIASGGAVDEAEAAARRELGPLPIAARAEEVTLPEEQPDQAWVARAAFPPGDG
jgi:2'-5' RNA ligase